MFSNPTPSKPRFSPAATMSDATPSALTLSLHCASILQPTTPPPVVDFEPESKTISAPICLNQLSFFKKKIVKKTSNHSKNAQESHQITQKTKKSCEHLTPLNVWLQWCLLTLIVHLAMKSNHVVFIRIWIQPGFGCRGAVAFAGIWLPQRQFSWRRVQARQTSSKMWRPGKCGVQEQVMSRTK